MATIAEDLAKARNLTRELPAVADDGVPPLEVVAEARNRSKPAAAIYARHSSSKQKSIPAQVEKCRARCADRGWNIKYVLKDEGRSAVRDKRDAFDHLLDLIRDQSFDVLVVWKIDRIVRNLAQAAVLREFADEHGIALHSVIEPIDTTTSLGRFIFGIIASVAQLEIDINKERVTMGIEHRASEGRWARPHVPFGYRRTKGNYLRVIRDEAKSIERCFVCYLEERSYSRTAMALNSEGCPWKGGEPWTENRVRQTLENPAYDGRVKIGGVESARPQMRIVSRELFQKVRMARRARGQSGRPLARSEKEQAIDNVFSQYLATLDELD